jgi:hypothetical protein
MRAGRGSAPSRIRIGKLTLSGTEVTLGGPGAGSSRHKH